MDEYKTACSCKYRSSKGCFVLKNRICCKKGLDLSQDLFVLF